MLKLTVESKHLLIKFLIFSVLFILASGVTGSWVVGNRLLNDFYFFIYGNLGKMVLISAIVFGLLIRNRLTELKNLPKPKTNLLFLILAFLLTPVFFVLGNNLLSYESFTSNISLSLLTHLVLILIPAFLLIGVFGINYIKGFIKTFHRQLLLCLGISIIYSFLIFQVWKLWPYFSDSVLKSVSFLVSLTSQNVQMMPPRTLVVNDFGVIIGQACSGLDSLFLFMSLYVLIAILDFRKFNKKKLILMIIPAAIGLYLVNILRVYILVMIGAYISPDLSIKLFHTYLGMILFILYFFLFWRLFYPRIKKKTYHI